MLPSIYFLFVFLFFLYFYFRLYLSGGLRLGSLGEVRAHEALEVEVGKLVGLLELKEGSKLGVRVDLATILLVLELVVADVGIDVTGDRGASHLSALLLTKERGKLVTDAGGLNKTTRSAVSGLALALRVLLLGSLKLTSPLLLKSAVLSLKTRDQHAQLLELGVKLKGLLVKSSGVALNSLSGSIRDNGGRGGHRGDLNNRGSLLLRGGSLLGLGGLLRNGSSGNNILLNNGGLNGSISGCLSSFTSSCHIILYLNRYFLSDFTQYIIYCD